MQPQGTMGPAGGHRPVHGKHVNWNGRIYRLEWFTLSIAVAAILIAAIVWTALGNANIVNNSESSKVNSKEYQAVFLNGGATSGSVAYTTYFGHITKLNDKYMILQNVYYLTTASTDQNAQPQLTKLGCQQLHSPEDAMYINRSQVAFWENLKDNGKVVTAIKQFVQQNPNGPNCNASTSSTGTSTTSTGTSATTTQNSSTTKQ